MADDQCNLSSKRLVRPARKKEHLVKMPPIVRTRTAAGEARGYFGPELRRPATDAFITDFYAALHQQFLNVAITQGEAIIQPNGMTDDG